MVNSCSTERDLQLGVCEVEMVLLRTKESARISNIRGSWWGLDTSKKSDKVSRHDGGL